MGYTLWGQGLGSKETTDMDPREALNLTKGGVAYHSSDLDKGFLLTFFFLRVPQFSGKLDGAEDLCCLIMGQILLSYFAIPVL